MRKSCDADKEQCNADPSRRGPCACGRTYGDFDESPNHAVTISKPFRMGALEVTNEQYEQYDPAHRALRGSHGMSLLGFEAVTAVSWANATGYARWLSEKDPEYDWRLPTEAEWEYACRAGTTTNYNTGDELPKSAWKNQQRNGWSCGTYSTGPTSAIPMGLEPMVQELAGADGYLRGGMNPPNSWGVLDCHGNVEEWVSDWYGEGYYATSPAADPVGPPSGAFRVSRGGSYGTEVYYLRSGNRMGNLPDEATWLVGFRVLAVPNGTPAPVPDPTPSERQPERPPEAAHGQADQATAAPREVGGVGAAPEFFGPKLYIKIKGRQGDEHSFGPLWSHHNHDPALTGSPSGDLVAVWFTTWEECGREAALAIARLPGGRADAEWTDAESFYDPPDRCMCCPALFADADQVLAFFSASPQASYGGGNVLMRRSTDSGRSWGETERAMPSYAARHMCVETVLRLDNGMLALPADTQAGGTSLHLSADNGSSWHDPGGAVAGIHGAVVQLKNGSLLGFGRGADRPCAGDHKIPVPKIPLSAECAAALVHACVPQQKAGGSGCIGCLQANNVALLAANCTAAGAETWCSGGGGQSAMCQAQSLSSDMGRSWAITASPFPAVHGGQRHVVLRLAEGPILFIGFANGNEGCHAPGDDGCVINVTVPTTSGDHRTVFGLFAAVSEDDGRSFVHYKLISAVEGGAEPVPTNSSDDSLFSMSATQGEPAGYCSAKQVAGGMIHAITSRNHYGFNLAWLTKPAKTDDEAR
jgi:formylglycine-generating enzyme required for sulfatase activity